LTYIEVCFVNAHDEWLIHVGHSTSLLFVIRLLTNDRH
jgi:hypothetical protein